MARVSVVIATYEPNHFFDELLRSLESQERPADEIIITDDSRFALENPPPHVSYTHNPVRLGAVKNFESALKKSTGELVALCDQDDVWTPPHIKVLEDAMTPGICYVYGEVEVVDEKLNTIAKSFYDQQRLPRTPGESILVQNTAPGCASMVSRELIELSLPLPPSVIMHDWWLAILAYFGGTYRFVNEKVVKYRQHSDNVIGSASFSPKSVAKRVQQSYLRQGAIRIQAIDALERILERSPKSADLRRVEEIRNHLKAKDLPWCLGQGIYPRPWQRAIVYVLGQI